MDQFCSLQMKLTEVNFNDRDAAQDDGDVELRANTEEDCVDGKLECRLSPRQIYKYILPKFCV